MTIRELLDEELSEALQYASVADGVEGIGYHFEMGRLKARKSFEEDNGWLAYRDEMARLEARADFEKGERLSNHEA